MRLKRLRTKPSLNITPLIDIVFILLIFFAVTTTFFVTGVIDVDLPKAETAQNNEKRSVVATVTKTGKFFINGTETAETALEGRLSELYSADAILVIEADEQSAHGLVVRIIDSGKLAGFTRFAIATEQK